MTLRLNELISEIQMLSLTLSTQSDAETRRVTLISIREKSWEATDEIIIHYIIPTRQKPRNLFGVEDL